MSFKKLSKNILNIDMLTVTPSMLEVYGYELKGGNKYQTNAKDIKKLTKLLEDSDITQHNELSSEIFMGSENETDEKESSSSSSPSSSSSTNVSDSSSTESELEKLSDLSEDEPNHLKATSEENSSEKSEASSVVKETSELELKGGANKSDKSNKSKQSEKSEQSEKAYKSTMHNKALFKNELRDLKGSLKKDNGKQCSNLFSHFQVCQKCRNKIIEKFSLNTVENPSTIKFTESFIDFTKYTDILKDKNNNNIISIILFGLLIIIILSLINNERK